jgi:hypothetical protein
VAPVNGGLKRLLPPRSRSTAGGQQPEAVFQPLGHLLDRKRRHSRSGKLDRQRQSVEPAADLGDGSRIRRRDPKVRSGRGRSIDKQLARFGPFQRLVCVVGGKAQRLDAPDQLAFDAECFSAGGQEL